MDEVKELSISEIVVGKHDIRLRHDDDEIQSLSHSIARLGVISPLVVVVEGKGFRLVAGHRRLAACKVLNMSTVPCIIKTVSEGIEKETSLGENLYRKDLSPIELAAAIGDCVNEGILSVKEVGVALNRSTEWVNRQIAMLGWPKDVLAAVHEGHLSVSAASNLAMIDDTSYRGYLVSTACEGGATARTTAAWLQAWRIALPREEATQMEPVDSGRSSVPALPQAPCICCGEMFRTDSLSLIMMCSDCISTITGATRQK